MNRRSFFKRTAAAVAAMAGVGAGAVADPFEGMETEIVPLLPQIPLRRTRIIDVGPFPWCDYQDLLEWERDTQNHPAKDAYAFAIMRGEKQSRYSWIE